MVGTFENGLMGLLLRCKAKKHNKKRIHKVWVRKDNNSRNAFKLQKIPYIIICINGHLKSLSFPCFTIKK